MNSQSIHVPHLGWLDYPLKDEVATMIYRGHFEASEQAFVWLYLREGDHCIDAGAHMGFYSFLCAKLAGEEGKVYAFEPDKITRKLWRKNAKNFHSPSLSLFANGLWEKSAKIAFNQHGEGQSAHNNLVTDETSQLDEANAVRVQALDGIKAINEAAPFAFIKIDCEGSERKILKGASKLLQQQTGLVTMIEFNEENLNRFNETTQTLWQEIESLGLKLYRMNGHTLQLQPAYYEGEIWYENLFATNDVDAANKRLSSATQRNRLIANDILQRASACSSIKELENFEYYKQRAELATSLEAWAKSSENLLKEDRERLKRTENELDQRCSRLSALEFELQECRAANKELQNSLEDSKSKTARVQKELDQSAKRIESLESELGRTQAKTQELQSTLSKSHNKSELLQNELSQSLQRTQTLESALNQSRTQNEELQNGLNDSKETAERLQSELTESEKRVLSLEAKLDASRAQSDDCQSRLSKAQEKADLLQNELLQSTKRTQTLESTLNQSRTQNEELQSSLRDSSETADRLQSELTKSEKSALSLEAKLDESRSQNAELQKALNDAQKSSERFHSELSQTRKRIQLLESKLAETRTSNNELQSALADSQKKSEQLQSELLESTERSQALESQLADSEKINRLSNQELTELKHENRLVKQALTSYRKFVAEKNI